jgi:protein tyrosine phosphatase (PTP) superfamily phosphohydrolase (DUF442 family)
MPVLSFARPLQATVLNRAGRTGVKRDTRGISCLLLLALIGLASPSFAEPSAYAPAASTQIAAPQTVGTASFPAAIVAMPKIDNFQQVSPMLCRGAQPSDDDLAALANFGVKTIIDLRSPGKSVDHEEAQAAKLGLKFVKIPMFCSAPTETQVKTFLGVVNDERSGLCYVHCLYGADRTGTMVGIYREVVQNWSFDQTYKEMRDHNFKPYLLPFRQAVVSYSRYDSEAKDRILVSSRLK